MSITSDDLSDKLGGTSRETIDIFFGNTTFSACFFKPYDSMLDFSVRSAAIIVSPLAHLVVSIVMFALSLYDLFNVFFNFILLDTDASWDAVTELFSDMAYTLFYVVNGLFSPVIEIVDLIGGGITTIATLFETSKNEAPEIDATVILNS